MNKISTIKEIRQKVKAELASRGMNFMDLSREIGVGYRYLQHVLSGLDTSRPVIKKISEYLNIPTLLQDYEQILHSNNTYSQKNLTKDTSIHTQEDKND